MGAAHPASWKHFPANMNMSLKTKKEVSHENHENLKVLEAQIKSKASTNKFCPTDLLFRDCRNCFRILVGKCLGGGEGLSHRFVPYLFAAVLV